MGDHFMEALTVSPSFLTCQIDFLVREEYWSQIRIHLAGNYMFKVAAETLEECVEYVYS